MDPNETLKRIRELVGAGTGKEELYDLVAGLDLWLTGGGFLPDEWRPAVRLPGARLAHATYRSPHVTVSVTRWSTPNGERFDVIDHGAGDAHTNLTFFAATARLRELGIRQQDRLTLMDGHDVTVH